MNDMQGEAGAVVADRLTDAFAAARQHDVESMARQIARESRQADLIARALDPAGGSGSSPQADLPHRVWPLRQRAADAG